MRPPLLLDIGWRDLVAALWFCVAARRPADLSERVESAWSPDGDAIACLSARSGLDLYLRAAQLPVGSEVILTGFTIPDIPRVIADHGLVPVPVDIDVATGGPRQADLEALVTPRTRALLVAHLFGARLDLDTTAAFAAERRLALIEDAAQAFAADDYRGHHASDVAMFSFGMIKTATALGGGLLLVRDPVLRERMRAARDADPFQARGAHLRRVARAGALKVLALRPVYGALVRGLGIGGVRPDEVLRRTVRGFPGTDLMAALRRRPSAPLLALLRRRVSRYPTARVARRARVGEKLAASLGRGLTLPGRAAPRRTHWVFPILAERPGDLVRRLREAGFDATRTASVTAVGGDVAAVDSCRTIDEYVVYVPLSPDFSDREVARLAAVLAHGGQSAAAGTRRTDTRGIS